MSLGARLAFLAVAVVIAVVAVVVLGSSGGDDEQEAAQPTATPTGTPTAPAETETPTATPTPTRTPRPIPTLRAGRERTITVEQGDTVRFRVVHSAPEEVHVHGYDLLANVAPGKPARFQFRAEITGIFEIELEHSHTPVGRLRVEPG